MMYPRNSPLEGPNPPTDGVQVGRLLLAVAAAAAANLVQRCKWLQMEMRVEIEIEIEFCLLPGAQFGNALARIGINEDANDVQANA